MTDHVPQPLTLDAALQQAFDHHQAGQSQEAEQLYRAILQAIPDHAEANHQLGLLEELRQQKVQSTAENATGHEGPPTPDQIDRLVTLFNSGNFAELEIQALALIKQHPDSGFAWSILGGGRHMQGKDALHAFQKTAELAPNDAATHHNLGNYLEDRGCADDAVASYRRALEIEPDLAETHSNLGNVLRKLGQFEDAAASCKRALALKPHFADAYFNLGNAERDLGWLNDAALSYLRAVEIKPDFVDAHCNLGNVLRTLKQFDNAAASYRRALELKPDSVEAHCNFGNILRDLKQLDNAAASYRRALEINPDWVDAHNSLGTVLRDGGNLNDALACYRRAIEIDPDDAASHSHLGITLQAYGQHDEAVASYGRALQLQPLSLLHAIHFHLTTPFIFDSSESVSVWRRRYQTGITALMDAPGTLDDPGSHLSAQSFFLAYHNQNDRDLMECLCHFYRARLPALAAAAPRQGRDLHSPLGQRIRVGFLSEFLVKHTITKLFQGFIRHLDRSRFEVVIIHTPQAKQDRFSHDLNKLADKVLTLPTELKLQQQAVMSENLDVLFYPDIGMAPSTYFLAYARLAPVQAVSWGHPDTTGLDTMDYFLSAASIEPENAENHYTERLIRLNRLPCFYEAMVIPTEIPSRTSLGLPTTGTLYGCPQTLFKFHPDFDGVLEAIAKGDPTGTIVLLDGAQNSLAAQLKARWQKYAPTLLERVLFLPNMPMDRFMGLIANMDVLLDPIHFGSGNTLYEAMVYGIPVVTWPGDFMRGRIVAGAYAQMGVSDAPIAARLGDYANLALALGRDPQRRSVLRQALQQTAAHELFSDMHAVREFESFLEAAVAAAARREKLPADWKPVIPISPPQSGRLT